MTVVSFRQPLGQGMLRHSALRLTHDGQTPVLGENGNLRPGRFCESGLEWGSQAPGAEFQLLLAQVGPQAYAQTGLREFGWRVDHEIPRARPHGCLLYTSDAADE